MPLVFPACAGSLATVHAVAFHQTVSPARAGTLGIARTAAVHADGSGVTAADFWNHELAPGLPARDDVLEILAYVRSPNSHLTPQEQELLRRTKQLVSTLV